MHKKVVRVDRFHKSVTTAMFSALTCVATFISFPVLGGYKNLGDCIVLLSGCILGPLYGALAGGIGSALCDFLLGYAYYVPGTLIIKGSMAAVCGIFYKKSQKKTGIFAIVGMVFAELIMVIGYFLYKWCFLADFTTALLSMYGNLIQSVVGLLGSIILLHAFSKNKILSKLRKNQ